MRKTEIIRAVKASFPKEWVKSIGVIKSPISLKNKEVIIILSAPEGVCVDSLKLFTLVNNLKSKKFSFWSTGFNFDVGICLEF